MVDECLLFFFGLCVLFLIFFRDLATVLLLMIEVCFLFWGMGVWLFLTVLLIVFLGLVWFGEDFIFYYCWLVEWVLAWRFTLLAVDFHHLRDIFLRLFYKILLFGLSVELFYQVYQLLFYAKTKLFCLLVCAHWTVSSDPIDFLPDHPFEDGFHLIVSH